MQNSWELYCLLNAIDRFCVKNRKAASDKHTLLRPSASFPQDLSPLLRSTHLQKKKKTKNLKI